MARRVFFSFHYPRDIWRVNQIRNIPNVTGTAAAGFQDASLWEEAKKKGDAEIKKLIDKALENTSVTVVFIGAKTAGRKYINYEIQQSIDRGNGIVGVRIHHLDLLVLSGLQLTFKITCERGPMENQFANQLAQSLGLSPKNRRVSVRQVHRLSGHSSNMLFSLRSSFSRSSTMLE